MLARRLQDILLISALAALGLAFSKDEPLPALPGQPRAPGRSSAKSGSAAPGRDADKPSDIPAKGWWQIAKRVYGRFSDDRVMANAAGVTFYTLLAIFPAIASLISLYGLIADPSTIGQHLSLAAGVIPEGGMQIIGDQVKSLTSAPPKALGFGAILGIATSLWSANAGIKALFDALNVVYEEKESRGFIHLTLTSLAFTLGALAFIILAISAVVVLPAVLSFVGIGSMTDGLLKVARWPLMLAAIAFLLAFIYRYGPSRSRAKWRWISWGSGFSAIVWVAASLGFSFYVSNFGNYNRTYGSLGAAVGFMTWIWISSMIVLIGAELNAEMEHQTARDTTKKEAVLF
jgi:membrane protein